MKQRRTVGILTAYQLYKGSYPNPFATPILRGVQKAALDQDINLLMACGISSSINPNQVRAAWPDPAPDSDFVPVGPWNTDGLIVIGPLLSDKRTLYFRNLMASGFPVVRIETDEIMDPHPIVHVDEEDGIQKVMEHLVEHGHRKIAFIAGNERDLGASAIRLAAFQRQVEHFGLDPDPRLVAYGRHYDTGGYNAIRKILGSGASFTAVVCSNDQSATGVLQGLHEAGIRVPWDVAVTGFDDINAAVSQVPPLTSIHIPIFEMGYQSLLLLNRYISAGSGKPPDSLRISTWLVPRQSCGCLPEIVTSAGVHPGRTLPGGDASPKTREEDIARWMMEALTAETGQENGTKIFAYCRRLVDAFACSLREADPVPFRTALMEILEHAEALDENVHAWQSAITVLRSLWEDPAGIPGGRSDALGAEDLLHEARTMISESAQRRNSRLQAQLSNHEEAMGRLAALLLSTLEMDKLYAALDSELPQVGIHGCRIAFFQPAAGDPFAKSQIRVYSPEPLEYSFETRNFPPPGLYPEEKPFSLALLPLCFQEETLGYVAFDSESLDPLATVVRELASAVKSIQLHGKVLDLSLMDPMTELNNRRYLDLFLQKEADRARRYNRDLAAIFIDIDRFKQYNDEFGHPAGDEALKEVGRVILAGARRGLDAVTRYGGEEFVVILPETDAAGARVVAENIRRSVEQCGSLLRTVQISLGIAAQKGEDLNAGGIIDCADRALYQAKKRGRNQSVVFEDWMVESAHRLAGRVVSDP